MSSADVIVISSTERPSTYTPQQHVHSSEKPFDYSPRSSSPLSLVSPSELIQSTSRSKYFHSPCEKRAPSRRKANKEAKDGAGKECVTTIDVAEETKESKPKRRRRKISDESQGLGSLESASLAPDGNVAKTMTKSKKTRANNSTKREDTGNKRLKGKIVKKGDVDVEKGKKVVASRSTKSTKGQDDTKGQSGLEEAGLHLEGAMSRRLDWTPPKNTSKPAIELDGECSPGNNGEPSNSGFGSLLSGYNFSGASSGISRDDRQISDDSGPTKRRRIEVCYEDLVPLPLLPDADILKLVNSRTAQPSKANQGNASAEENIQGLAAQDKKKPKKQAKKLNTLTARVTAQYVTDDMEDAIDIGEQPYESIERGRSKPKPKDSDFIVLSPEAAAKTLDDQDLVFGTCSQLEREDSPAFLNDMQMAIHASESSVSQEHQSRSSQRLGSGSAVSRFTAPRNLWSVAARDSDGLLVQGEVLDMVEPSGASKVSFKDDCSHKEDRGKQRLECFELEDEDMPREEIPVSNSRFESQIPPDLSQTETNGARNSKGASEMAESQPMPQYSGFTDTELSRKVAAYGFKPLKSRQKMIDLLQKCWESKYGPVTKLGQDDKQEDLSDRPTTKSTLPQPGKKTQRTAKSKTKPKSQGVLEDAPKTDTSTTTPKRKPVTRKQPRKTKSSASQAVEEIEDSEDETILSPNRVQSRYVTHPTSGNQSLPISTDPSKRTSLPDLGTQITKAVRAQPRLLSSGRAHPSWHEKILMYDPIILEDFATWLNTEGLGLVGEDREVGAGFVREWCESKGICCCWKKGES